MRSVCARSIMYDALHDLYNLLHVSQSISEVNVYLRCCVCVSVYVLSHSPCSGQLTLALDTLTVTPDFYLYGLVICTWKGFVLQNGSAFF